MNKLVSRNPVQRFKQGRKITKAQGGLKATQDTVRSAITNSFLPNIIQKINQKFSSPVSGYIGQKLVQAKRNPNSIDPLENAKNIFNGLNPFQHKNTTNIKSKEKKNIPLTEITTPVDNYYLKGFENRKDEIAKLGGVRAVQKMLGFTEGNGLDGKWGKNTEKAYNEYLQKNAPTLPTSEQLIQQVTQNTPVIEEVPQAGTNTIQNQLAAMQEATKQGILPATSTYIINPTLPKANRSDIRELIRKVAGKGAYDFTGAQRKALRQYINGEKYNENDLAVFGNLDIFNAYKPGFYKQGGNLLPSRNIVQRFKQRNFTKVAQ